MSKENDEFLSLYRKYEGLLRSRDTDYRTIEEESKSGRMTIMRQMRNYLAHSEDPGFISISPVCLKFIQQMVKEEELKGDIVKNHLITPAKGSMKEGTLLSAVIYKMIQTSKTEIPVYDDSKMLKGTISLERAAYALDRRGNIPLEEVTCGPYGAVFHLVKPNDPTPLNIDDKYYCCTKDGTMATSYMGYLDK